LWAVPNQDRVPRENHGDGCLFWIRKDLVRARRIRPEDLHPVSKGQRIIEAPTTLSWAQDIRPSRREKTTYAEVLRRMEAGGCGKLRDLLVLRSGGDHREVVGRCCRGRGDPPPSATASQAKEVVGRGTQSR
jgi:hypothetical protein